MKIINEFMWMNLHCLNCDTLISECDDDYRLEEVRTIIYFNLKSKLSNLEINFG